MNIRFLEVIVRTKNEQHHKLKKAEILEAATICFAEKGIRQTTMQEICAKVKMSPGSLYRYYASKEDIIADLAANEREGNDELISYLTSQKDIVIAIREVIPEIVKQISVPNYASLSLEVISEAARNPKVAKLFLDGENKFKKELATLLEKGKTEGHVDESIDSEAFSHMFVNLLDSLSGSFAFPVRISKKRVIKALDHLVHKTLTPRS